MTATGLAALILGAIGGAKILEQLSATPHQKLQKKAVHTASRGSSDDAAIYAAHTDESNINENKIDGHTSGVLNDVDGSPDFIVQDFPNHLIAEVEDADGLQDVDHVLGQLEDYSTPDGYTTLLVVPDEEETLTVGNELADRTSGTVYVTPPSGVAEYL